MFIPRALTEIIKERLTVSSKVIILYGPRQSGKTTLVNIILKSVSEKIVAINADEKKYIDILSSRDFNKMRLLVEKTSILFIDEAQRIPDIGINLKILHDQMPSLKIIATGSSSFELASKIKEPLTGRTNTYILYPVAFHELRKIENTVDLQNRIEEFLIYGTYPEIYSIQSLAEKQQYLRELSSSYLYKDIFELTSIKHSSRLDALLRLLAFQIGSQVSLSELGNSLNMSKDTVASYIDLLEKAFVIFRLPGFSRNLRKEVVKMDKIYFYDLGIRNTIIDNYNGLQFRDDHGKLWENFIISERKKYLAYTMNFKNSYFWRTYTGAELDYVEEGSGRLSGFEIKWSERNKKAPASWLGTYNKATYKEINKLNFMDFISDVSE
jgi:predicted AAA+ superfamily ATPase